ncbi:hypothetical protein JOL79_06870 [Microbispora sp. RL4-1S]|uniref:Uncharacterized protein n=1 Tax=Microbispora oryzae TaxID=2806554 RepID=A0A940WDI5_9ACTN|nr:hypothetical protein [Microbispora oryzae]MBP2703520.1 hypothetical protein [Microbispora oryzae]
MDQAAETVELLVPAAERPRTARALLAAAASQGLPAEVVRSTSTGYVVPVSVADGADVELAAAGHDGPLPGAQLAAAHPPRGRVAYTRDKGPGEGDEQPVEGEAPADLPEPVRGRRAGRK